MGWEPFISAFVLGGGICTVPRQVVQVVVLLRSRVSYRLGLVNTSGEINVWSLYVREYKT